VLTANAASIAALLRDTIAADRFPPVAKLRVHVAGLAD